MRITGNVFADIPGDVNPHAVHIEGSDALNEIDNNIFSNLTGGILAWIDQIDPSQQKY